MDDQQNIDVSRREALRWTIAMTSATLLAPLTGCGDGPGTEDTLYEPVRLHSVNGVLDIALEMRFATESRRFSSAANAASYPAAAPSEIATTLRSFNGRMVAPTLVLNAGDTLRVKLINSLPPNTTLPGTTHDFLNYQNSSNLHFHGMHVDPKEIRQGVFGDYVVDHWDHGVKPGESRQHEVTLPSTHTPGCNWYHPHLHGSSMSQVSSGMFGAILCRHPDDHFASPEKFRERVIFVHKLRADSSGKLDTFAAADGATASSFLLNGVLQPTLVMRPGEVQNWHFICSETHYPFNPSLDGHTLHAYAIDGNPFKQRFQDITAQSSTAAGSPNPENWPGGVQMPGNRLSVLIRASDEPGTYLLRSKPAPASQSTKDEIVARIVVEGTSTSMSLPDPRSLFLAPEHRAITDEELAAAGGIKRTVVLSIKLNNSKLFRANAASADPNAILIPQTWFAAPEKTLPNGLTPVFSVTDPADTSFLTVFQAAVTPTLTVALNSVEEWTVSTPDTYPHPFHIHVNECYVTAINGKPVKPYWADTLPIIPLGSVTFRTRFADFTGAFVWHCHALGHEDLGMMQAVQVV